VTACNVLDSTLLWSAHDKRCGQESKPTDLLDNVTGKKLLRTTMSVGFKYHGLTWSFGELIKYPFGSTINFTHSTKKRADNSLISLISFLFLIAEIVVKY
jgi:hypothetical protein